MNDTSPYLSTPIPYLSLLVFVNLIFCILSVCQSLLRRYKTKQRLSEMSRIKQAEDEKALKYQDLLSSLSFIPLVALLRAYKI